MSAALPDTGARTLEAFAAVPEVNRWIFGKLAPHLRGDVLEVGSGIGNLSGLVLERAERATLSDRDDHHLDVLRKRFEGDRRVSVARYDLDGEPPPEVAARRFDAVVAMNVFEHIADDRALAARLGHLLAPGGALLVYVPACPFAFGALDHALGHYRRYTPAALANLFTGAGLTLDAPPRYVNLLGLLGWIVSTQLLRLPRLPRPALSLFQRLLPLIRLEDHVRLPIGVGLWVVARFGA
jgi:SAM-dependent methyltransferase